MAESASLKSMSEILPFHRHLGVSEIEAADGRACVRLGQCGEIRNLKGDVHGGAVAALLDIAMSRAVRSANIDLWGLATVSMTVNYLEPARGALVARAHLIRNGRTLAVAEATVEGGDRTLVAQATAVFRKTERKPKNQKSDTVASADSVRP